MQILSRVLEATSKGFGGFLAAAVSEENMRGLGMMEYGCSNSLYAQHECVWRDRSLSLMQCCGGKHAIGLGLGLGYALASD